MIPALALLAAPAAAAVYVPEPVQLFDGLTGRAMTLAEMGDEGLDPDRYATPWKGNGAAPSFAGEPAPAGRVPFPCGGLEYMLPEHRVYCGSPAAGSSARPAKLPPSSVPRGGGSDFSPVPVPAAIWLALTGVAALMLWRLSVTRLAMRASLNRGAAMRLRKGDRTTDGWTLVAIVAARPWPWVEAVGTVEPVNPDGR